VHAAPEWQTAMQALIPAKPRPKGENVVDLMDALKKSISNEWTAPAAAKGKKPRKAAAGQKGCYRSAASAPPGPKPRRLIRPPPQRPGGRRDPAGVNFLLTQRSSSHPIREVRRLGGGVI
jgi:hypothetical protein